MRVIISSLLCICFQLVSAQSNIDVLHYKFNIGLNDVNDTIHGVAEIKVRFLIQATELSFDLTEVGNKGKGMKVGKLQGNNIRGSIHKEEKLR